MSEPHIISYWRQRKITRYQTALARLEAAQRCDDSYFDELSKHFHLGTVGGSGRNVRRLDKHRMSSIDRQLDRYKRMEWLRGEIARLSAPPVVRAPVKPQRVRERKPQHTLSYDAWLLHEWHWFGSSEPRPGDGEIPVIKDAAAYWHNRAVHGASVYELAACPWMRGVL